MSKTGYLRVLAVLCSIPVVFWGYASVARAAFVFGEPTKVPNINSGFSDHSSQISRDGLELYFASTRPSVIGGAAQPRIWVSKRPTTRDPWSAPVELDMPASFAGSMQTPSLAADGLELYFSTGVLNAPNPSGYGGSDIWVMTRSHRNAPWGEPVNLGPTVNTQHHEDTPCISADGLELYFARDVPGHPQNSELLVARRPTKGDPWGEPVNLGPNVNSIQYEYTPWISPDGLSLFFSRGYSKSHIRVSRRATTANPWGWAEFFAPVNSGSADDVWRSSPGQSEYNLSYAHSDRMLYFSRGTTASETDWNIWQVEVIPIMDFNGDGVVDTKDLVKLIESWGQADPLCDIGPMLWGDGVVDAADLEVFMRYWGQQVDDPTLVGHWPLDEAEGMIAYDLAGGNNGTLMGLSQWRPEGGKINGAVELTGLAWVTANSPVNPVRGPFSVLAWVQGGAPGQVIISQQGGTNWLMTDSATGALRTELSRSGRTPLSSESFITDGAWRRIAFTWDGRTRRLYVDGDLVAEDSQETLAGCTGKVVFGTGTTMAPATFWAGLIDEVRIYNRVVRP